ncbi:hypothetical protein [Streptosporangium sp. NPDC048865]|uniref:hypothetical protein n=1 Tax=Streptosporangium sp. NPDC048865 TaxID=3155766 RepID=UPI003449FC86
MSELAGTVPLFDAARRPLDPGEALRVLTERYATGADRQAWIERGVTLPLEQAVLAVLADPQAPPACRRAALALTVPARRLWEQRAAVLTDLARAGGDSWSEIGRVLGVSKQAAQQQRTRQDDVVVEDVAGVALGGPAARTAVWLEANGTQLRALASMPAYHGELRDLSMDVAVAVSALSKALYLDGDAQVLAAARALVAAVERAHQEVAEWQRPWVAERTWAYLGALAEFLTTAP